MLWKFYPRKTGKKEARRAFERALKRGALEQDILQGLARQLPELKSIAERDVHFVPHFTTWLNQDRWEDQTP